MTQPHQPRIICWSPEAVETLTKMAALGHCANDIAKALGAPKGRAAVCGKASRLGIALLGNSPDKRASRPFAPRPNARKAQEPQERRRNGEGLYGPVKPPTPPTEAYDGVFVCVASAKGNMPERSIFVAKKSKPVPAGGVHWTERGNGCAWPVGGDGADTFSCGAEKDDGCSYCEKHRAIAFTVKPSARELGRDLRRYV